MTMRSSRSSDRTVHASISGAEIVRYDRAGKWYLEPTIGRRQHITLREAALKARYWEQNVAGAIFFGRSGGSAFDRIAGGDRS